VTGGVQLISGKAYEESVRSHGHGEESTLRMIQRPLRSDSSPEGEAILKGG
jgi:hypothetical protein